MSELNDALIEEHSRTLKLPALRREYGSLARHARAESWSYEEYLFRHMNGGWPPLCSSVYP